MFRRVRPPPPSAFQAEMTQLVTEAPMDDLLVLHAIVTAELGRRQGREKYQLPEHVLELLN